MASVTKIKDFQEGAPQHTETTDMALFVRTSGEAMDGWDRSRIVDALLRETFIDEDTAEDISLEVENEIRASGIKMIHMNTRRALKRAEPFKLHNGLGILFLGTEGWVLVSRGFLVAEPKSLLTTTIGPNEIRLPRSTNHRRNFIECVKTRRKTVCPIETAVRSDTICHLDDIAIRLERKLRWDPKAEQFIRDEQANRMLTRPMRSPWHF